MSVFAVLLACAACTGKEPAEAPRDGALRLGGTEGTLCIPADPSNQYTYGLDAVENSTGEVIQIEKVALVGANGATVVEGYLAPIEDNTLLGAMGGWPPQGQATAAFQAKKAVPVTIDANASANLVIHVEATAPADIKAVEVTYTHAGKALRVATAPC